MSTPMSSVMVAAVERVQPSRSTDLIDRVVALGEVSTAPVLEEHDGAFDRNEHVTPWVARGVELHVANSARVADVDGVEEDCGTDVVSAERRAQSSETLACCAVIDVRRQREVRHDRAQR
jgi:hypothetical protein